MLVHIKIHTPVVLSATLYRQALKNWVESEKTQYKKQISSLTSMQKYWLGLDLSLWGSNPAMTTMQEDLYTHMEFIAGSEPEEAPWQSGILWRKKDVIAKPKDATLSDIPHQVLI